jgi:O-antigen/teichoic acid export membrane protein
MIRHIHPLLLRLRSSPTALTAFSGYAAMFSIMVAGVFSVPLALRFLTNEEFGLWNVIGQSLGYLLLIDFGVSWSASRMLVGPLRAGDSRELDSWWTVLVSVLVLQGLLVVVLGFACRDFFLGFFEISPELLPEAHLLWSGMIIINAIQLPFRAYTGILYCQDRWYVMHLTSIISSWLNLIVFAALLYAGHRMAAYLVASSLSIACNSFLWYFLVRRSGVRLSYRPQLFDLGKLAVLFRYSSGIFLLAMAAQITFMSQSIIIGKVLGLGAVAAFVVSSKSFTVVLQLARRAFDAYSPRWMQLFVGGDRGIVGRQWQAVMSWLLPATLAGAFGILIFNRSFAVLYGGSANHESRLFDLLLAAGLLVQVVIFSTAFTFHLSARIRGWCLAGIGDAVVQVSLGVILTRWFGSSGLLAGALLGPAFVSIPFLILRAPAELGMTRRAMFGGVGKQLAVSFLALGGCYGLLSWASPSVEGWWPTPVELSLGVTLGLVSLVWLLRLRNGSLAVKQLEA